MTSAPLRRVRILAIATGVALLAGGAPAGVAAASADPPAPPGTPTAHSFAGTPTVGPIFRNGLARVHSCSASVLASRTHDLIITAAHCVTGTAVGYRFAPGYDNGKTPYGVWTVKHAYLNSAWLARQAPQHDFAILQLTRKRVHGHRIGVQDVTGGNVLGRAPNSGTRITDIAYNAGIDDRPIRCVTHTYDTGSYPSFNCHGYVGGSSGSPWLATLPKSSLRAVVGVIGGLHQGGCYEYTSYSSAFRHDVERLRHRATGRDHPDTAPAPGSDGC